MRTHGPRPIRVAYVVDTLGYGGAEIYVRCLLRAPAGVVRPSLLVARPGVAAMEADAREAGVPLASFARTGGKLDIVRLCQLARAIGRARPDVVHLNMTTATNNRHAIAAAWLARLPVVATLHSPVAVGAPRHTLLLRGLFSRLRAAIAVSRDVRRILIDDLHVPAGRVRLIPNGVADADPLPQRPASVTRIVAAGRLEREKGFDVLIDATRRLVARGVRVEVAIFGEGSQRRALEDAARDLPVTLPGFVADPARRWQDAHLFCLPSRLEGLPLALLEAMMHGLPCVASNVGDVADALGSSGVAVPPGDPEALANAIAYLCADPALAASMGAAARVRARASYSVDTMIARTLEVYAACVRDVAVSR
jgi:glycosyltransferase involved in cell wall biosynthesis